MCGWFARRVLHRLWIALRINGRNNSGLRESCSSGINYLYLIKSKPPFRLTVWIIRIDAHRLH